MTSRLVVAGVIMMVLYARCGLRHVAYTRIVLLTRGEAGDPGLLSDWSKEFKWPEYCSLISRDGSRLESLSASLLVSLLPSTLEAGP